MTTAETAGAQPINETVALKPESRKRQIATAAGFAALTYLGFKMEGQSWAHELPAPLPGVTACFKHPALGYYAARLALFWSSIKQQNETGGGWRQAVRHPVVAATVAVVAVDAVTEKPMGIR